MLQKIKRFLRMDGTRLIMRLFWLLPLKKKQVFFSAYEGKQYACNPKAVFEEMYQDPAFGDYTFVWELNRQSLRAALPTGRVQVVEHNSFSYFLQVLTSKYLVTNSGISGRIPLRKGQVNINTWHGGGAFKRLGHAVKKDIGMDLKALDAGTAQTTWFLSSSRLFTEIMLETVPLPPERYVPTGMPRNDIFFRKEKMEQARNKVLEHYGLAPDSFLLLYAPTYRGRVGSDSFQPDGKPLESLSRLCESQYGRKTVLMVRMHYFSHEKKPGEGLPVSDYPDMQELLAAADILVTDYSSSVWDYALTGKLCILYAPDLEDYIEARGFYTHPSQWPGILCRDEGEMLRALESFDGEAYKSRLKDYFARADSYDTGNASKQVADLIKQ